MQVENQSKKNRYTRQWNLLHPDRITDPSQTQRDRICECVISFNVMHFGKGRPNYWAWASFQLNTAGCFNISFNPDAMLLIIWRLGIKRALCFQRCNLEKHRSKLNQVYVLWFQPPRSAKLSGRIRRYGDVNVCKQQMLRSTENIKKN